jgi:hypothetical protein
MNLALKWMLGRIFRDREVHIGEGMWSGTIACYLSVLCFLAVLAFHFPEYLTTPELRQSYDVSILRSVMFVALIIAGALGLLNIVRNKRKRLGGFALALVFLCIALGGHRVEVGDFSDHTPYLGLD